MSLSSRTSSSHPNAPNLDGVSIRLQFLCGTTSKFPLAMHPGIRVREVKLIIAQELGQQAGVAPPPGSLQVWTAVDRFGDADHVCESDFENNNLDDSDPIYSKIPQSAKIIPKPKKLADNDSLADYIHTSSAFDVIVGASSFEIPTQNMQYYLDYTDRNGRERRLFGQWIADQKSDWTLKYEFQAVSGPDSCVRRRVRLCGDGYTPEDYRLYAAHIDMVESNAAAESDPTKVPERRDAVFYPTEEAVARHHGAVNQEACVEDRLWPLIFRDVVSFLARLLRKDCCSEVPFQVVRDALYAVSSTDLEISFNMLNLVQGLPVDNVHAWRDLVPRLGTGPVDELALDHLKIARHDLSAIGKDHFDLIYRLAGGGTTSISQNQRELLWNDIIYRRDLPVSPGLAALLAIYHPAGCLRLLQLVGRGDYYTNVTSHDSWLKNSLCTTPPKRHLNMLYYALQNSGTIEKENVNARKSLIDTLLRLGQAAPATMRFLGSADASELLERWVNQVFELGAGITVAELVNQAAISNPSLDRDLMEKVLSQTLPEGSSLPCRETLLMHAMRKSSSGSSPSLHFVSQSLTDSVLPIGILHKNTINYSSRKPCRQELVNNCRDWEWLGSDAADAQVTDVGFSAKSLVDALLTRSRRKKEDDITRVIVKLLSHPLFDLHDAFGPDAEADCSKFAYSMERSLAQRSYQHG